MYRNYNHSAEDAGEAPHNVSRLDFSYLIQIFCAENIYLSNMKYLDLLLILLDYTPSD